MLPNGELHILSVRQGDENHQYNCRVLVRPTGQTLTSSSSGRIILLASDSSSRTAPVILESAAQVSVWRGQEAVLPCVFHGHPPPKIKSVFLSLLLSVSFLNFGPAIRWYRSQTAQYGNLLLPLLIQSTAQRQRHRLVGVTLIIGSVAAEDEGRYVCAVNNSAGLVQSRTQLVYREKIHVRIAQQPVLVVDAETPVTLTCVFGGNPRPAVVWIKDGHLLQSTAEEDGQVHLRIPSVRREDQGVYQCVASSEDDAAQASVQLSVGAFPPQLTQTFARQVIHPGSSVSLKCVASGTPLPHFTWTLDGSPLPVSPDIQRYFLGQQQDDQQMAVTHLNISHVRVEDGGHYKVLRLFAGQLWAV